MSSVTDEREGCWSLAETGGPSIAAVPAMLGFGSKMVARSLSQQLSGDLSYDWQPSGLVATVRLRKDRLTV